MGQEDALPGQTGFGLSKTDLGGPRCGFLSEKPPDMRPREKGLLDLRVSPEQQDQSSRTVYFVLVLIERNMLVLLLPVPVPLNCGQQL